MNDLEIVVATQEYIKTHHNDADFSIETICNAVGYSRRQLDRLFTKYLQMSVNEYIKAVTLTQSAKSLLETNKSIAEISFECGFSDSSHFILAFKKKHNLTPLKYRKMLEKH